MKSPLPLLPHSTAVVVFKTCVKCTAHIEMSILKENSHLVYQGRANESEKFSKLSEHLTTKSLR